MCTAVRYWVQEADLQHTDTRSSNYIALGETDIQLDTHRYWLYAAVDAKIIEHLYIRPFWIVTQVFRS